MRKLFIIVVIQLLIPSLAFGCFTMRYFDIGYVRHADTIFVGELSDYQILEEKRGSHALLTFKVESVLKGFLGDTVVVRWDNSTFALSDKLSTNRLLIATGEVRYIAPLNWAYSIYKRLKGEHRKILQEGCTKPFMFEVSDANIKCLTKARARKKPYCQQLESF